MTRLAALCITLVACKSPAKVIDAAVVEPDATIVVDAALPLADAPPLATCTPRAGRNVAIRKVIGRCVGATVPPQCVGGPVTLVTAPPNDGRLFLVEKQGVIQVLENEIAKATPFLDVQDVVETGSEQGLLGLAFHPSYATNRMLFVYMTRPASDPNNPYANVIVRYQSSATDPNVVDPSTATDILVLPYKAAAHNGGMLSFGPDGFLYASIGDGGFSVKAPDPTILTGKMLRIDVDHPSANRAYGIPADNPYADGVAGAPEVFMVGLRNPWRFAFDRTTNDMWIGDVGQATVEEIDLVRAGEQRGANLGWPMYEGNNCLVGPCDPAGKTFPVVAKLHADGFKAIIGGDVYRGSCFPDLTGAYLFSDTGQHTLFVTREQPDGRWIPVAAPLMFSAAAGAVYRDARGELYVAGLDGNVWQVEAN